MTESQAVAAAVACFENHAVWDGADGEQASQDCDGLGLKSTPCHKFTYWHMAPSLWH